MYGNYSYGKRHLGRVVPKSNQDMSIGKQPSHPNIFVGPITVTELKKRMELDQRKLENRIQNRKCLVEKNQNGTKEISPNLLPCSSENKENLPSDEKSVLVKSLPSNNLLPPEINLCDSKDNSDCSNHTYTLDNSPSNSPSQLLNSTYDKFEETENFNLQIDITHNPTPAQDRKSAAIKSNFRNYRQNRQDSLASEVNFNVNKTTNISQLTDTSTIMNGTNRSVLISFDNLKLDDECGNVTNMSMNVYKESPVAKILMDDKFSHDYRSPKKNKGKYSTPGEKSKFSNTEKLKNEATTPKSPSIRKSVVENRDGNKPTTPKSTNVRKSISKNLSTNVPVTPKLTPVRKSVSKNKTPSVPATPPTTPVRKSASKKKDDVSTTPTSTKSRKSFSKDVTIIESCLEDSTITSKSGPSAKRKLSQMKEEDTLNASNHDSPTVHKTKILNKENVSVRKTPGKMSATWVTELKAENYLINSSLRDSTDSCGNRSTPDVFQKTTNEMWKPKLKDLPEKETTTPFKSKLPQLRKTPNKYRYVDSPVCNYIHRGEGIKSMSKLRHSSCVNEFVVTSKSETKIKLSESKNKPCKIPQRNVSVQRKLDLPKMDKSETSSNSSSIVSRISSFRK